MQEKNYDLGKILKPYTNKWVALSQDHRNVIAHGDQLKDVTVKVKSEKVVFLKVFPANSFYMPQNI